MGGIIPEKALANLFRSPEISGICHLFEVKRVTQW
jgi:hypothetical protein